jgi:hypothetical protein
MPLGVAADTQQGHFALLVQGLACDHLLNPHLLPLTCDKRIVPGMPGHAGACHSFVGRAAACRGGGDGAVTVRAGPVLHAREMTKTKRVDRRRIGSRISQGLPRG